MAIFLTDAEAARQRRAMKLRRIKAAANYEREVQVQSLTVDIAGNPVRVETTTNVPKHHGVYIFKEDCGNLGEAPEGAENRPCTIHDQEALYPRACKTFAVGSATCLARRAEYGLDGHEPTLDVHDTTPVEVKTRRSN
jgi:hypothetical protein